MIHSQILAPRIGFALVTAGLLLAFGSPGAPDPTATKTGTSAPKATKLVDVNSADEKALETLPGVRPAIAKNIIDGRPYKSLSDLEKVKGLSKTKVDALKDRVVLGPMSTVHAPSAIKPAKTEGPAHDAATGGTTPPATSGTVKAAGNSKDSAHTSSVHAAPASAIAPGEKVNINTANATELDKLPGIGPVRAQAIIDYRNQNGRFKSIDEIENIKGIKESEFSKIKERIKVSD